MLAPAMMSSVIPARLDFQCGHAALVSLPRVKGESSAARNQRIALEKSGAHRRNCDFCAPHLELVVAEPVAPAPVPAHVTPVVAQHEVEPAPAPPVQVETAPVVAEPVAPAVAAPTRRRRPRRVAAAARPTRRRRRESSTVTARSAQSGTAAKWRYVVQFEAETVLEAADLADALRLAAGLGATQLLAITREA
jgi:type IV secretory pathway VirB10-like protein